MSHITKIKLHNGSEWNVPAEMTTELQKAHACMQESGYRCNASWEGFAARSEGKKLSDNPYSIITNIIENRRWAYGFDRAENTLRIKVHIRGEKGNWFIRIKETGEVLISGFKKETDAFTYASKNRLYTCN